MEIKRGGQEILQTPGSTGSLANFRMSKILTNPEDIIQWGITTKAVMAAGISLTVLEKAGIERGDQVDSVELSTLSSHNLHGKIGEVIEGPNHIQAWQERGEVLITNQLESPEVNDTNNNIIPFPNMKPQTIKVIEEVGVFTDIPTQISQPANNLDLTNNPYLLAPAELKKAA